MTIAIKRSELLEFVQRRKKSTGGFSATRMLPATIQDTYHALRLLTLLGEYPAGHDLPLLDYLRHARQTERHSAKVTFHGFAASQLAGEEVVPGPILTFVRRRLLETPDLEEWYYCSRLVREVSGQDSPEFDWLHNFCPPWSFRTLSELWMLLYLADHPPENREALTTWVQNCQVGDGGFGFLPKTTSFLENCYDGLRALRQLGSPPRNPQGCREFILACQTRYGGLARRSGALAFLSTTWQGAAALALLSNLEFYFPLLPSRSA